MTTSHLNWSPMFRYLLILRVSNYSQEWLFDEKEILYLWALNILDMINIYHIYISEKLYDGLNNINLHTDWVPESDETT